MAHFMIGETGEAISWFHVPLNRTVTLVQWGGDAQGNKLEVAATVSPPALDINPLGTKMKAASTAFTIRGVHPKTSTHLVGWVAGSSQRAAYTGKLEVWTGGAVQNHTGYEVDLLANAARHGDASRVHMYSKFLYGDQDNTNPMSQRTTGKLNCGEAARAAGPKLFGGTMDTTGGPQSGRWYKGGHGGKMANLRFDPARMAASVGKIKGLLRKGNPVRLWMVHHDGFADTIGVDWRIHFVTLIGLKGDRFLIFDPWPGGSVLKYAGGVYGEGDSQFLGELEFDPGRPELGLRSPAHSRGYHDYVAVAGP